MQLKFNFYGVMLAAGLLCSLPAYAQKDTTTLHTVSPRQFSLPAKAGPVTRVLPENEVLSITGAGINDSLTIELGWMPARPNTAYQARYRLRAQSLEGAANVHVMIREHEAKNVRPLQPYQKESVRNREVKAAQNGNWIERRFNFTTGGKTQALSGAIVITALKGELQLSAFELLNAAHSSATPPATPSAAPQNSAQAQADYQKLMAEIRAQADARVPLTPRPLVFSRSQMKYGLEQNYYHEWNDRPLLVNRAYRVPSTLVSPRPSYERTLEEVAKYDIDGLAFFPETKGRMAMFDVHEQIGREGIGLLPEFVGAFTPDHLDVKTEILQRALKNKSAPRINGKLLITSYGAESLKPAEWKQILDTLRQRVGDTFIFLPSVTNLVSLRGPLMEGNPLTRETIEKEKAFLRSYLDVCDGIYFNYPAALRNKDRTFDEAFYRDVFIPVFKSVLTEPAYRGKYLGLSAYKSHMSPERGNSLHEDGTRTLRRSFEAAMNARPDVIILPEWDEQNENTSFRPTVYGSRTSERIIRYYMSRIKDKAPTPVPGDDTTIPNLILSTRKIAALGENLNFELLNVPDSSEPGTYTVELSLQDETGKVVRTFAPVTFNAAQLQEERVSLATETVPSARALVPVLTIRGYKGRDMTYDTGFHAIQLRATWNWDHLAVKQPLRDLLRPNTATFAWEAPTTAGGPLTISGSVSSPEDLNLVEVLGDDDEASAVDPANEFFRNDPTRELFIVEYRSLITQEMKGSLTLQNANAEWITNGAPLHQPEAETEVSSNRIELSTPVSEHQRWIYLAIPKSSVAAASLNFDFDKAKFSLPLRDVLEKKMIARNFENGLHITVAPYHRQIDMPQPLNKKDVSFRVQVWPEIATEQYHMRLTSVDGKTFRTRPLLVPAPAGQGTKTLRVYSDAQQRGVDTQVAADRIPQIVYDFVPDRGAVLLTEAGRPFWSSLGGFTNTTSGRGTLNALFRGKYPAKVERSAPVWVNEGGAPCLEFDGAGTYLELPRETIPSRGAFTIGFEIKPVTSKDQFLLVNRVTMRQHGLSLEIREGKLFAAFADADWKTSRFPTQLSIPANEWSSIGVRYDFENLTLTVNGKSESFPLSLPAMNTGFTVIGEGWTGNWFEGRLRNLRIVHNAE